MMINFKKNIGNLCGLKEFNLYGILFILLSLSGHDHFGFKTLLWLLELLIVMPVQTTGLWTSDCSWKLVLPREGELCQK